MSIIILSFFFFCQVLNKLIMREKMNYEYTNDIWRILDVLKHQEKYILFQKPMGVNGIG